MRLITTTTKVPGCEVRLARSFCPNPAPGDPYKWADEGGNYELSMCPTHLSAFDANNAPFRHASTATAKRLIRGARARSGTTRGVQGPLAEPVPAKAVRSKATRARKATAGNTGPGAGSTGTTGRRRRAKSRNPDVLDTPAIDLTAKPPASAEVRAWAKAQGKSVSTRGKLPADLVAEYAASGMPS